MSQKSGNSLISSVLAPTRYQDVSSAFDSLARGYDETFDPNIVISRLRTDLYHTITNLVDPPAAILDINCGTGTDALYLSSRGYSTVGVDISEAMIAEAVKKSAVHPKALFVHTSYDDMDCLPENEFDLVLSNFGGLNCTRDLRTVGEHVARRLKAKGYFVVVLMPSFSLWETCAYAVRGQFKQAFRRLRRGGTLTQFNDKEFTVYYFNPHKAAQQFAEHFLVREIYAWNIVTPPPHAWKVATSFPRLSSALEKLDAAIGHLPIFRSIGDHYVMVLEKRSRKS
jgi:ubiquinone/menaquinone biosynthesis C-methylase UbiE